MEGVQVLGREMDVLLESDEGDGRELVSDLNLPGLVQETHDDIDLAVVGPSRETCHPQRSYSYERESASQREESLQTRPG
jgi:hypothetical protein